MVPKTIVVPLDESALAERALEVARPLARELSAPVVLVTTAWADPLRAPAYLESVVARGPDDHIETEVLPESSAADAIRHVMHERSGGMVCMTTHGRGRLRWAAAGSVAEDVIGASSVPILLVGPRGEPTWSRPARRIIVAVDGSPAGMTAVRHACEWAKALDLQVVVSCVVHPLDVEGAEHPEKIFEPHEALVRAEGLPVESQLISSRFVAGALVDAAEEPPATMIVMAVHRHSRLARLALGSVTMGVLAMSTCPVLVVPPGEAEPAEDGGA
jgi:nucleotide-binding universal stress UspA family protein